MNFTSIAYVPAPGLGAIDALGFIAAAGLLCGVGGPAVIDFAGPSAASCLIAALLLICSIVRFERR